MLKEFFSEQFNQKNLVQGDFLQGRSFTDAVELYRLTTGHDGKEILMRHITEHNAHLGQYRLVYHQVIEEFNDGTETTRVMYTYSDYLDRLSSSLEFVDFANDGLPILRTRTYGEEDVITDDDEVISDEIFNEINSEIYDVPEEAEKSDLTTESVEVPDDVVEESSEAELTWKQPKKPKKTKDSTES